MTATATLGEWIQKWIDFYAPVRCTSGVTIERYQRLANYLLDGATCELSELSTTPLSDLTHQKIEIALLTLLTAPAQRRDCLSRRSVRHLGGLLSVALNKAARLDMITVNPMPKVELPRPEKPKTRSLTIEEVNRLRLVCRHDWTGVFVELALATGCRRGELLALLWEDINHHTRALSITKSVEETKKGLKLKAPKSGKTRRCTLPHSTMLVLPAFNKRGDLNEGLLFPDEHGCWRRPHLVSQTIVRRLEKAHIRDASLHTLRHTHASLLISEGVPLPAVSSRLGHHDPSVTARIYSHALPLDDQRAADQWDDIIAGI